MKYFHTVFLIALLAVAAFGASAQMMNSGSVIDPDDHTAREEAEGRAVWEKLQAKEINCANLSDEDFGALGEYFMGQMVGGAHPAMNAMMERMMGEAGEEQAHVVMGQRLSGCDTDAVFPSGSRGFLPMMQFMWGARLTDGQGWSSPRDGNTRENSMMWNGFGAMSGYGGGAGFFFWITTLLIWAVLALVIIALWRWIQRHK